jgi:hypothetical protein
MKRFLYYALMPFIVAGLALTAGCEPADDPVTAEEDHHLAEVRVEGVQAGTVTGHLTLSQDRDDDRGVRVEGQLSGFQPNQNYVLRVHEGSCGAPGEPFRADPTAAGQTQQPAQPGTQQEDTLRQDNQARTDRDRDEWGRLGSGSADSRGIADVNVSAGDFALVGNRQIVNRILVVHGERETRDDDATTADDRTTTPGTGQQTTRDNDRVYNPVGCGQIQQMETAGTATAPRQ